MTASSEIRNTGGGSDIRPRNRRPGARLPAARASSPLSVRLSSLSRPELFLHRGRVLCHFVVGSNTDPTPSLIRFHGGMRPTNEKSARFHFLLVFTHRN